MKPQRSPLHTYCPYCDRTFLTRGFGSHFFRKHPDKTYIDLERDTPKDKTDGN